MGGEVGNTRLELLDGKFAGLAITAHGFVNATICARTDEADNFVSIDHSDLALVSDACGRTSILGICPLSAVVFSMSIGHTRKGGRPDREENIMISQRLSRSDDLNKQLNGNTEFSKDGTMRLSWQ